MVGYVAKSLAKPGRFRRSSTMMFRRHILILMFAALSPLLLLSCKQQTKPAAVPPETVAAPSTSKQIFQVKGVVKELNPDGKTVVIQHEEVPHYMPAMTMPFEVKNTNELRGLQPGDAISFQLIVTDSDGWIDHITKSSSSRPAELPSRPTFRLVRDVDPLQVGDLLPEYHFTNELGQSVSTKQFRGQAFAFTFFFTRCPYPTFCPLMSSNFEAAEKKLLALPDAPKNWHLFSISFDPEMDSPEILKAYAQRYDYQPEHWSFLTGDLIDLTAIGDQVGEYFGHDESGGGISHNLRTVVVDAQGRVQKIITDNKWTSDDLVAELLKAAAVKP
ncbi:MAG: Electron transport protein SCO1/SenC [Pedosphaera sp.]|nr:Electron transport protein SCO1/SenC [Pedosphaera sp.]